MFYHLDLIAICYVLCALYVAMYFMIRLMLTLIFLDDSQKCELLDSN